MVDGLRGDARRDREEAERVGGEYGRLLLLRAERAEDLARELESLDETCPPDPDEENLPDAADDPNYGAPRWWMRPTR